MIAGTTVISVTTCIAFSIAMGSAPVRADPAYRADAKKRKLTIQPTSRVKVEAAVAQVVQTPAALLAKIKTILGY